MKLDHCYEGDCRDVMRDLIVTGVRVQCIVTSPPYWGLRQYLPPDTVQIRRDLTPEQRAYVLSELVKAGVL